MTEPKYGERTTWKLEMPIIPWPIWLAALDVLKAGEAHDIAPCTPAYRVLKDRCSKLRDLIARYPVSLVPPVPKPIFGMTPELKSSFDECLDLIEAEAQRTGKSFDEILHSETDRARVLARERTLKSLIFHNAKHIPTP